MKDAKGTKPPQADWLFQVLQDDGDFWGGSESRSQNVGGRPAACVLSDGGKMGDGTCRLEVAQRPLSVLQQLIFMMAIRLLLSIMGQPC